MEDIVVPLVTIPSIFLGLPWMIMHYVTKWKQAPRMTDEDEKLLDEMYNLARRLEERLNTVERIVAADNPDFRAGLSGPAPEWRRSLDAPQPDYPKSDYQIDRRN